MEDYVYFAFSSAQGSFVSLASLWLSTLMVIFDDLFPLGQRLRPVFASWCHGSGVRLCGSESSEELHSSAMLCVLARLTLVGEGIMSRERMMTATSRERYNVALLMMRS